MKTRVRSAKKRRAKGGFSLAETLVTLVILAIMGSLAVSGVSQALRQRDASIALSDAQTVASTAAQVVSDQLRYGQIAGTVGSDGAILLSSGVYGNPITMGLDENGYLISQGATTPDGTTVNRGRAYSLLGTDAYCGMCISRLEFDVDRQGDEIRSVGVSLEVSPKRAGAESLWELNFSVTPMDRRAFVLEQAPGGS